MKHIIDTDELEPCPFCGSPNISAGEVAGKHLDGTYFVQTACMNCGALSPEAKTENESVGLWNRRKANSQVVNSAPFGYVDLEQAIRAFDYGYGAVYLFNPKELKAIEDYDPLYTTPQPAPDTVPLEKYNKLIGILKRMEGWLEVRNLGGLMPDEKALIAEAEEKE